MNEDSDVIIITRSGSKYRRFSEKTLVKKKVINRNDKTITPQHNKTLPTNKHIKHSSLINMNNQQSTSSNEIPIVNKPNNSTLLTSVTYNIKNLLSKLKDWSCVSQPITIGNVRNWLFNVKYDNRSLRKSDPYIVLFKRQLRTLYILFTLISMLLIGCIIACTSFNDTLISIVMFNIFSCFIICLSVYIIIISQVRFIDYTGKKYLLFGGIIQTSMCKFNLFYFV